METLISLLNLFQKFFWAIGPFCLLLGVLIFIHELGHFLAARYFGVQVEVFSLGFGPKILKYKRGNTVYCLSLFPLGGYVKMFGDDPMKDISDSDKAKGFLYQRVPAKWLIAFAGPFMNLIFTLLAFFLLALFGLRSLPPQLGDIKAGSPAYSAGFRSGDTILSVDGKAIAYYEDIHKIIKNKAGENLSFRVKSQANEIKTISATSHAVKNPNLLDWKKSIGSIKGLRANSKGLRIGVVHNSPAYRAGLRTFDDIVKVNGQNLRYWRDLKGFIKNTDNDTFSLSVKRKSETKNFTIKRSFSSLTALGIEPADLYIDRVGANTPAGRAGFLRGDRLLSINGQSIQNWEQVLDAIKSYSGQPFSIKYQRQEKQKTLFLSPEPLFVEGNAKKKFMLGIVSSGQMGVFPEQILRKRSFFQALAYSGEETWKWLGFIAMGFVRLIQGEISLRTMGGPVMIGRVAHSSFHQGLSSFLFIMALISLNLFFINLLPIPMLDGGHLLFFSLEGILGRPLSVKKLIVAQQTGLLVLLSFMGFAIFNDIYNWLKAW